MWNLAFISESDFTAHVRATIEKYGDKLIVGEDLNGHCIRVSIENRNDLGHFVLDKKIEELEEELLPFGGFDAGVSLSFNYAQNASAVNLS